MAGEYQLSYTGPQVNEKLGKIDGLATTVNNIPSIYETITSAEAREQELKDLIGSGGYVLPTASANIKGGVKIGDGLTISGEVLSYTLPTASTTKKGGVKIGDGLNVSNEVLFVNTIDNLKSTSTANPLSANQGKILNDQIQNILDNLYNLGYGDMLKLVYDADDDGIVDNSMKLNSHYAEEFLFSANPSGTGSLSLNRLAESTQGEFSTVVGRNNSATQTCSFAEGYQTQSTEFASHAEGNFTIASGPASHAEGLESQSIGAYSHAEGKSIAKGNFSHSEGILTSALGLGAHAEGSSSNNLPNELTDTSTTSEILSQWTVKNFLLAQGESSHAQGFNTLALGAYSHAEGSMTQAIGENSHAEGKETQATGVNSHAEGLQTIAEGDCQHVQGKYNISDTTSAFIIGNGTASNARSNIFTIDSIGNAWVQGDIYIGSTSGTNKDEGSKKLITFDEIPTNISAFTNDSNYVTETGLAAKGYLTSESDPTVPDWAKAVTKPSYTVDEITNALSYTLLNAANGIATLDENKNLITNEGINITNGDSFYFTDSQENVIAYIDSIGVHSINIYTTDREYTKNNAGDTIEKTYNLNYELANLNAYKTSLLQSIVDLDQKITSSIKIAHGSYIGTGTYGADNPNTLTFDFEPKIIIIQHSNTNLKKYLLAINGVTGSGPFDESGSSSYQDIFNWEGNTFSWYHSGSNNPGFMQYNESGTTYYYFAIGGDTSSAIEDSNSNDNTTITFTVSGVELSTINGTTWAEFLTTDSATGLLLTSTNGVIYNGPMNLPLLLNSTQVLETDTIIENGIYYVDTSNLGGWGDNGETGDPEGMI